MRSNPLSADLAAKDIGRSAVCIAGLPNCPAEYTQVQTDSQAQPMDTRAPKGTRVENNRLRNRNTAREGRSHLPIPRKDCSQQIGMGYTPDQINWRCQETARQVQ